MEWKLRQKKRQWSKKTYDGRIVIDLRQELLQRGVLARGKAWVNQWRVARLFLGRWLHVWWHIWLFGWFLGWWLRRHLLGVIGWACCGGRYVGELGNACDNARLGARDACDEESCRPGFAYVTLLVCLDLGCQG